MVSVDDLHFSYPSGGFALRVDHLSVQAGERVAVVGPSGTGKTTLLTLIAGLQVPQTGRVRVGDIEVSRLSDRARRAFRARHIGFVFQDFALLDYLSVRENILYPYRVGDGLSLSRSVRDRADALADSVGLGAKLSRRPTALSQGEQQRVALCRALITEPGLILADEATGNLDPANKTAILDLMFARAAEAGAALLAVTHDHALLPRFDRVIDFADFTAAA